MASVNTVNPVHIVAQADNDEDESDETTTFIQSPNRAATTTTANQKTMGSQDKKDKKKDKAVEPVSTFNQHMTTAAHACILLFVILIIYFCFSEDFQFFTWHPLLLSVGWMFLMTEAILTVSKDNLFTGTLPKKVRIRLHWIFLSVAAVLILSGFAVVFINKNDKNKPHFKTWHAFFGLIGIICLIPTIVDGILALYHGDLRNYIRPRTNKFIHIASGVTTFTFGGLALVLSVYTMWFERHSAGNIMTFIVGLALASYPVAWTLIRPSITLAKQVKGMIKVE